ncbi:MAG: DUF2855 family protein [Deltaproteobacteria bacterium]|nr:DUF2855 family protein [Deltaproteobacteria bacterium]MBW2394281.1 DUF2855 family protein [Deltaproteobacteria bacterium]
MTSTAPGLDFLVRKDDWHQTKFVDEAEPGALAPGRVRFRVDRFALTANNITYAVAGDMLGYWRFFPAEEGWGRIPAMGFGDVIASTHPDVAEGTRCFGFFPMSRYLEIQPGAVTSGQIVDAAPHRKGLAPAYAQYSPVDHDDLYTPDTEDLTMLLRGLFLTSFLAEDFLSDQDLGDARTVLISSASSKTSIALAHRVAARGQAKAIGLTSSRNLEFVKGLGTYDEVRLYDEISSLPADAPAIFVDMAGDGGVTRAIYERFEDQLKYTCNIGVTHWEAGQGSTHLQGPKPEFFFAPTQIQKRIKDWGSAGFQERVGAAWTDFRKAAKGWLQVERGHGREALANVYADTLEGRAAPATGNVLSLWEGEANGSS